MAESFGPAKALHDASGRRADDLPGGDRTEGRSWKGGRIDTWQEALPLNEILDVAVLAQGNAWNIQFPCGVNPRVPLVAEAGKPSPMVVRRWCSLPFLSVAIYADVNQKPPCRYNRWSNGTVDIVSKTSAPSTLAHALSDVSSSFRFMWGLCLMLPDYICDLPP